MSRFDFIKLDSDEEMIFGPLRIAKNKSPQSSPKPTASTPTMVNRIRKIGLTSKRLIIEQGEMADANYIIPNCEIKTIIIRREKSSGYPRLVLEAVQTISGETTPVDLTLMDPQAEAKIKAVFPNVRLQVKRGCLAWLSFLT